MKLSPLRFLVAPFLALLSIQASVHGAVIIFDDFNGAAGTLDGTTPDAGPATWAANSFFATNGSALGAGVDSQQRMAYFDLGADYFGSNPGIYELSMTVNLSTNTTATTWWAIGFSANASTVINNGFNVASDAGSPWMFIRQTGEVNVYAGPGTLNPLSTGTSVGTGVAHTIRLVLDSTDAQWTVSAYVDSTTLVLDSSFTPGQDVRYVGITSNVNNSSGAATADNFLLQTIPEPHSIGLLAAGGLAALLLGGAQQRIRTRLFRPICQWRGIHQKRGSHGGPGIR